MAMLPTPNWHWATTTTSGTVAAAWDHLEITTTTPMEITTTLSGPWATVPSVVIGTEYRWIEAPFTPTSLIVGEPIVEWQPWDG